jgi:hypothetical protein
VRAASVKHGCCYRDASLLLLQWSELLLEECDFLLHNQSNVVSSVCVHMFVVSCCRVLVSSRLCAVSVGRL